MLYSCANIIPPTGGDKDITPPKITRTNIKDSSLNFKQKSIFFYFNEPIQATNPKNTILITPLLQKDWDVKVFYNHVEIKIPDSSLLNETTYTMTIQDIKDVTENNTVKGLRYVFATGNYLDSMSIKGRVFDARQGIPDTGISILLYLASDSEQIVQYRKPLYISKTDETGAFEFANLPNKNFRIFALKDLNNNLLYDLASEKFAFLDSVFSSNNKNELVLYSFKNESKSDQKFTEGNLKSDKRGNVKSESQNSFITLKLDTTCKSASQGLNHVLEIGYNPKIKNFNTSKIVLMDTTDGKETPYTLHRDTVKKILKIEPVNGWNSNHIYKLGIGIKAFEIDSNQFNLKETYCFKTLAIGDYGELILKFAPKDSQMNYMLYIKSKGEVVDSFYYPTVTKYSNRFLLPGNYSVQVLKDENRNMIWNSGDFKQRHQPEKNELINELFKVKANWKLEYDIVLPSDKIKK